MSILCAPTLQCDLPPLPPNRARTLPLPDPAAPWVERIRSYLGSQKFTAWLEDFSQRIAHVATRTGHGLGHIEETVRQHFQTLERHCVEVAMQAKADATAAICPTCFEPLIDTKKAVQKTIQTYCGPVTLKRTHGYCSPCQRWSFPADFALGLLSNSTASPLVQEMSALLAAKMPVAQAEEIIERVAGLSLSRSTMAREAQRQGERGSEISRQLIQAAACGTLPAKPQPKGGTLVIQIDALNIRERDGWGQTAALRAAGKPPERWHWIYAATCFRLEQRCTTGGKLRAVITDKSIIATRQGIDAMIEELHFEAQLRGLATAERVLVIADGAVWIWNVAKDRFPGAILRLDLYHASAYLWAVASDLHGPGTAAARAWVKPLLRDLREDKAPQIITQLEELKTTLANAVNREALDKAIVYYTNNQEKMKYAEAGKRNEPKGSGAIESSCRQIQCRVKRCGQFWLPTGDEPILRLDTFWRNGHWARLFPHSELQARNN